MIKLLFADDEESKRVIKKEMDDQSTQCGELRVVKHEHLGDADRHESPPLKPAERGQP